MWRIARLRLANSWPELHVFMAKYALLTSITLRFCVRIVRAFENPKDAIAPDLERFYFLLQAQYCVAA
jgi:hypothetical protein